MLTENEFLNFLLENKINVKIDVYNKKNKFQRVQNLSSLKDKNSIKLEDCFIELKWVTGGMGGGNCYTREARYVIESEPEPEFFEFDLILEKICPNIGFLPLNGQKAPTNSKRIGWS